jgi:hypothetical protein
MFFSGLYFERRASREIRTCYYETLELTIAVPKLCPSRSNVSNVSLGTQIKKRISGKILISFSLLKFNKNLLNVS